MDVKQNILGAIGRTPMVRINSLWSSPCVNIFAKLEGSYYGGPLSGPVVKKVVTYLYNREHDWDLSPENSGEKHYPCLLYTSRCV